MDDFPICCYVSLEHNFAVNFKREFVGFVFGVTYDDSGALWLACAPVYM